MFGTQSFSCSSVGSNEPSQAKNEQILTGQHSCALVNTPLPCVNKAVHHIQELQLKMEKFFQQYDYVFKEEKTPCKTELLSAESLEDIWLSFSTKLVFKEADVSCEDGKTLTLKQETEALVLEVSELVHRLEADREEAQKALELEKQRGKKLSMKIDAMAIWRLQEVSAAVQKEYEMCMQDILELQWHLECKRCQQRQVQSQILQTEAESRKIQEDVDFMKKHSPLLEEKLNLEGEALKAALLAYEKASKIYDDLQGELVEIQKTVRRIDEESEKKIKSLYEEIKSAEMLLNQYKNELKQSELIWTEYCMKLKETEEKIIKDEKHLEELLKQKAEIQEDAKRWNSKMEDLKNKIAAQEDENNQLSGAAAEVIKTLDELKATRESDLQDRKQKLLNMNEALNTLKRENEELERENEELLQKFRNSSRKKMMYQSEVKSICKNVRKIEQQIEGLDGDLCNAGLSHSEKKRKYEDLIKKKTEEEISYKNLVLSLKKEIQEEKGVLQVTEARIKAIYDELEEKRKEALKKREEDKKRIEEIEKQVADLETEIRRKKDLLKDNCEKLSYLNQRVRELEEQQKEAEQQLEPKRRIMQEELNDIQEKNSFVSSQLAENSHTIENLKKKIKELNELWNMKHIEMENIGKSLADLRKTLSSVMFKQQNAQMVFNHLQDELAEYEERFKKQEKAYGELLQIRKKKLKESKAALEQIIKENLWLAQEYQISQSFYWKSKEDLAELYDNRVRLEAAVRDHQQERALQRRWRGLLEGWRSRGGLSIPDGLARIQAASQENAQKILAVQGELSKAIQHITTFLRSLTDGSPTPDNKANKRRALGAETKDKESRTVQITV